MEQLTPFSPFKRGSLIFHEQGLSESQCQRLHDFLVCSLLQKATATQLRPSDSSDWPIGPFHKLKGSFSKVSFVKAFCCKQTLLPHEITSISIGFGNEIPWGQIAS